MAEERLRFRCYRCNQLMGASLKKMGTIVNCPRCKAELRVPGPEEQPSAGGAGDGVRPASSPRTGEEEARPGRESGSPLPPFMEEIAAAIPDDLASLRPEDIRVEAEFADLVVTTTEPTLASASPPEPPAPQPAPVEPVPPGPGPEPVPATPEPSPTVPGAEPIVPPFTPSVDVGPAISLPPINIEPTRILAPGRELRSAPEIVLQPATVLAWSLLVLMALPMAFIAGLMIGHFIWK